MIEAVRGRKEISPWYAASHDEAALVMDGTVEVHLVKPDRELVPESKEGTVLVGMIRRFGWKEDGLDQGEAVGTWRFCQKGSAYQFRSKKPSVVLIQTIQGRLDHRALGPRFSVRRSKETMTMSAAPSFQDQIDRDEGQQSWAGKAKALGYKSFTAGNFKFERDEYFANIHYPGGRHIIPIDAYLLFADARRGLGLLLWNGQLR